MTAHLRDQWLTQPVASWRISSVVAAFDRPSGRFDRLLLALTATPLGHDMRPLDSPRMARDLAVALDRRGSAVELHGAGRPASGGSAAGGRGRAL